MRLDKYLKVSRLIKRRTVANEACDGGLVCLNGRPSEVKVGDVITLALGRRQISVEILAVAEAVGKGDASALYRELPNGSPVE